MTYALARPPPIYRQSL